MIKQLFIKDYKNTSDNDVRSRYGIAAGIFGIITNLILSIIKIIIGVLTNSVSIVADAVNNMSDMASSVLTIVGFKLVNKKPDKEHPYGHARYEYIYGLLIAIVMIIIGFSFAKESILKIINPENLDITTLTFIVLSISIILKVIQMIVYLDFSKRIKSSTLKTSAIDTRNDIISTSVILLSMIIMKIYNINIDGILGLMVSLFIIYTSIKISIEVMQPLVGILPDKKQINQIKKLVLSYDEVLGIHDLVIHNYGVNNDFLTLHVELNSKLSLLEAHDLVDSIENELREKYNIDASIHVDPIIVGNKEIDKLKNRILVLLQELDKKIEIHDFRVIEGKKKTKVLFDCVLPFDKDYTYDDLILYLKEKMEDETHHYSFYIEIDRPFC